MKAITSNAALAMAFASVSANELLGGSVVSLNFTILSHRPLSLHLSKLSKLSRGFRLLFFLSPRFSVVGGDIHCNHPFPKATDADRVGAKLIVDILTGAVGGVSSEDSEDIPCLVEFFEYVMCMEDNDGDIDACTVCFEKIPASDAASCSDLGSECAALKNCETTDCVGCPDDAYFNKFIECALKEGGCDGNECGTSQGSSVNWI